eukprot:2113817-Lingulodinium_polyedra.AAC.1
MPCDRFAGVRATLSIANHCRWDANTECNATVSAPQSVRVFRWYPACHRWCQCQWCQCQAAAAVSRCRWAKVGCRRW